MFVCFWLSGVSLGSGCLGVWMGVDNGAFSVGFVLISCDLASQHYPTSDDYICV